MLDKKLIRSLYPDEAVSAIEDLLQHIADSCEVDEGFERLEVIQGYLDDQIYNLNARKEENG